MLEDVFGRVTFDPGVDMNAAFLRMRENNLSKDTSVPSVVDTEHNAQCDSRS